VHIPREHTKVYLQIIILSCATIYHWIIEKLHSKESNNGEILFKKIAQEQPFWADVAVGIIALGIPTFTNRPVSTGSATGAACCRGALALPTAQVGNAVASPYSTETLSLTLSFNGNHTTNSCRDSQADLPGSSSCRRGYHSRGRQRHHTCTHPRLLWSGWFIPLQLC
jgi:hypothetical protein